MEGLGNDFVVVEGPFTPTEEEVRKWCDRRRGIGADGLLVATPLTGFLVRMEYWNADGSPSEMCGNGLRCIARYAYDQRWVEGPAFSVETALGEYPVEVHEDGSVWALLAATPSGPGEQMAVAGQDLITSSMGNPHAVILVDDCESAPVAEVGPVVEVAEEFPDRTNVEFVEVESRSRLSVRTWERGVGETLACGTGAGAAAFVANSRGLVDTSVVVGLRGGDLHIEIKPDGIYMTGPATYVFDGTISTDVAGG